MQAVREGSLQLIMIIISAAHAGAYPYRMFMYMSSPLTAWQGCGRGARRMPRAAYLINELFMKGLGFMFECPVRHTSGTPVSTQHPLKSVRSKVHRNRTPFATNVN